MNGGVYEFAGVERWNGTVEWSGGVDYWTGVLECWNTRVSEGCGERLTARAHTANSQCLIDVRLHYRFFGRNEYETGHGLLELLSDYYCRFFSFTSYYYRLCIVTRDDVFVYIAILGLLLDMFHFPGRVVSAQASPICHTFKPCAQLSYLNCFRFQL